MQGATILSITTFGSYLTGLLRDRIFTRTFGASRELDIYNAAFVVPDLLLTIMVSSVLSAAFIPLFSSLTSEGKNEEANRLANTVLHSAVGVVLIGGGLAAMFMPFISEHIAPGFTGEEQHTLASLSRFLLISPVLIALSSSFGAMLVSFKRFFPYGISAMCYNLGIIAGTFTVPWLGIRGVVFGTLVGAFFHMLPRLIAIRKTSFRYSPSWQWRDKNFWKVVKLALPKMVGHPVEQLHFLAYTRIASLVSAGSIFMVNISRNFQSVPVSVFGISLSVAAFPFLSESAGKGDRIEFLKHFWKTLRSILIFTIPAALGFFFLSELPIRYFLGGGKFTDEHVIRTANVLSIFAFSIPTESLRHLLARSFYALKNTLTPVIISLCGLSISVSFASLHWEDLGITAIPYGFFLGGIIEIALLGVFLRRKIQRSFARVEAPISLPR